MKDVLKGPFASQGGEAAEESLRLAYFAGRLDLIGWRPTTAERSPTSTLPAAPVSWVRQLGVERRTGLTSLRSPAPGSAPGSPSGLAWRVSSCCRSSAGKQSTAAS